MPKTRESIEKEKRIRIVMEWILEDWASPDIVSQIETKWGLSERQAWRYLAEGRKRWVKGEDVVIEHKRKMKIETLKKLKRSLLPQYKGTPAGIRAQMKVEDKIILLEQLEPAKKLEISGKDGQPIQTENTSVVLYLPTNGRENAKENH
jgi:hypothetical protein